METFVSTFGGWIGIIAAIVMVIPYIIGIFNKSAKEMKREESETAKEVVDLLSTKITVLESKVDELELKVDKLTVENTTLRDVLQGRDGETKQFYADARAAIKLIEHNDKISEENSRTLAGIGKLLETVISMNNK